MSRYDNYFNQLKKHNVIAYAGGSNLSPDKILTNDIHNVDYHANLQYTDTQHSNIRRNNDKVGGVELLEPILPISDYYGKEVPTDIQDHIKSANQKQSQKDKEKERMLALLTAHGYGINPTTGDITQQNHSLQHNNNHTATMVNTKKGVKNTGELVNGLINDGIATVHTKQNHFKKPKIPKPIKKSPVEDSSELPAPPPPDSSGIVF